MQEIYTTKKVKFSFAIFLLTNVLNTDVYRSLFLVLARYTIPQN